MRECDKCVHHTAGNCSQFDCNGTVKIEDVENKAYMRLIDKLEKIDDCCYASFTLCLIKEKIEELRNERD